MRILIADRHTIPARTYGGTERVIWDLGRQLVDMGHRVSYLVPEGSTCDFGALIRLNPRESWNAQIPSNVDVVHFQFHPGEDIERPHLITEHGNARKPEPFPLNTVFVSRNHAQRYGSDHYVLNGLDWRRYGAVDFDRPRERFHFLGDAAWGVKNVFGAIRVARLAGVELDVLGGDRFQWKRRSRVTFSRKVHFHGMVGGETKLRLLNASRGLIFPVRWHEPFGLAVIESLYSGCPVFATPYGALPEIVSEGVGVLSIGARELAQAVRTRTFDPQGCHEHAVRHFNATRMANDYMRYYERIMDGEVLHREPPRILDSAWKLSWHNG